VVNQALEHGRQHELKSFLIREFLNEGTNSCLEVTMLRELNLYPGASVIVGDWWSGDPIGIAGEVDNVRRYNRVLTLHEIVALSANYQVTSNSQRPAVRTAPVHKTF
jgi:hypothetical protein